MLALENHGNFEILAVDSVWLHFLTFLLLPEPTADRLRRKFAQKLARTAQGDDREPSTPQKLPMRPCKLIFLRLQGSIDAFEWILKLQNLRRDASNCKSCPPPHCFPPSQPNSSRQIKGTQQKKSKGKTLDTTRKNSFLRCHGSRESPIPEHYAQTQRHIATPLRYNWELQWGFPKSQQHDKMGGVGGWAPPFPIHARFSLFQCAVAKGILSSREDFGRLVTWEWIYKVTEQQGKELLYICFRSEGRVPAHGPR